jgi:hypothetical protein
VTERGLTGKHPILKQVKMSEDNFHGEKVKFVAGQDGVMIPGQTGRLTVDRKIT